MLLGGPFSLACVAAGGLTPSAGCRTVYPAETQEPLHNPHMGWAIVEYVHDPDLGARRPWGSGEVPYPWYDNVQVLFTWAAIERTPDRYDWSAVDRIVDYWVGKGKAIHIIAPTEYNSPGADYAGCPEWLYDLGVPRWSYAEPGSGSYPDYRHPLYRERLRKYLRAFADHFCANPHIETIDLRGYGTWGEWHSGFPYGTVEERHRALRAVFDLWREAVAGRKVLTLSVSYEWLFPTPDGQPGVLPRGTSIFDEYRPTYRDYLERSLFDQAFEYPAIAPRRNGVGGAVFQEYDGRLLANLFEHWRRPIFCEPFGGYGAYTGPSPVGFPNTGPGDDFLENAVDEALTHHANYLTMHWGVDFDQKRPALVAKAQRLMGYRFVLVRASYPEAVAPGGELLLDQTWENRAMGRCYVRYPLAVYLMAGDRVVWQGADERFDQTCFVSGQSYEVRSRFRLPADLPPGQYELRLAMVDEQGEPALALAMEGADRRRRYPVGPVSVQALPGAAPAEVASPEPLVRTPAGYTWGGPGALRPNRTYLVSFRYEVTRNPERDLNTDDPGFFRCYAGGGDGMWVGETRWFDKAGQSPAQRTVLLPLREREDYRLVWECVGGGRMSVEDLRLELLDEERVRRVAAGRDWVQAVADDLLLRGNAVALDRRRPPAPLPIVVASRDRSQVQLPDDTYDCLSTNPQTVRLEPNTVYTVWFTCAARPQVWQGDYLYLAVRSETLGAAGDRGFFMWTQRHTSNPVRRAYSFRTGDAGDYRLDWGLKNGGACETSQIVLVRR